LPEIAYDLALDSGDHSYRAVSRGQRARVLLGQLAAWAAGFQETFELEARLETDARVKAEESRRQPPGFGAGW
jgi:hypothetical protein